MGNSLEQLLAEGVVSEILSRVKSGKEADVYAVRQGGKVVAAKVYKDHAQRSFKNNAVYQEGRQVRNSRSQRAMDRGSRFGKEAAEDAWKSAEANTLYKLHAAGVRVPTPVMFLEGVLFMELVLGENGYAAPRLIDTELSPEQANGAYHDMLTQLVRMLCCDLIHGDLSPYNVLWAATGPTIIDFPQCVAASQNNSSERFFLRDARNILGHFAGIDPRLRARESDAAEIWRAYVRRELTPDFLPTGRAARPDNRPRFDANAPRAPGHRGPPHGAHQGDSRKGPANSRPFPPRDRPAQQEHRDRPAQQQHRDRPAQQQHRDRPAQQQHRDRPAQQQHRDRPAQQQHRDRPAQQQHHDRPAQQQHRDRPAQQQHRDRPAQQQHHGRGPRRPEVIVLRRSPKSAASPAPGAPNPNVEDGSTLLAESRFTSARPRESAQLDQRLGEAGAPARRKRPRHRG